MLAGYLVGIAFTTAIRAVLGLPVWLGLEPAIRNQFGFTEPAWVTGAIFGAIAFMFGAGVLDDWLKLANGEDLAEHPTDALPSGWRRYLSATFDHKAIGMQYGVTSLLVHRAGRLSSR